MNAKRATVPIAWPGMHVRAIPTVATIAPAATPGRYLPPIPAFRPPERILQLTPRPAPRPKRRVRGQGGSESCFTSAVAKAAPIAKRSRR